MTPLARQPPRRLPLRPRLVQPCVAAPRPTWLRLAHNLGVEITEKDVWAWSDWTTWDGIPLHRYGQLLIACRASLEAGATAEAGQAVSIEGLVKLQWQLDEGGPLEWTDELITVGAEDMGGTLRAEENPDPPPEYFYYYDEEGVKGNFARAASPGSGELDLKAYSARQLTGVRLGALIAGTFESFTGGLAQAGLAAYLLRGGVYDKD